MASSEVVISCLIVSLALYLIAIIIGAWPCGGLFRECHRVTVGNNEAMVYNYDVISGLLLVSILMTAISLICCLVALGIKQSWIQIVGYFSSFVAFIMALTMEIFFHTRVHHDWSSFLTTVGMTLCLQVFIISITELIPRKPKEEIEPSSSSSSASSSSSSSAIN